MISILCLANCALSLFTVLSSALPPSSSPFSSSSNQLGVIDTGSTNGTRLHDISSPLLSNSPECSYIYGRDLNPHSCQNALVKVSRSTTPIALGQRGTGPWDVQLPRRYLSDDGLCAIDITVDLDGLEHDISSSLQISNAASAILRTCVNLQTSNTGGVVKQLGSMYRSISVEVMQYSPQVQCHNAARSAPPSYYSCLEVIDSLQWSESLIKFGLPWQADTQVRVPYFLISRDKQCKLLVATKAVTSRTQPAESASWASVWASAVAVSEMCVKWGRSGDAAPRSIHGTLMMFLFGRGDDPPPEVLSSLNISATDFDRIPTFNATLSSHNSTTALVTNA